MKKRLGLVVMILALAFPAAAWGGYFSWGFNYVGASVNTFVASGWNEWDDQYVDKNSGDWIFAGFLHSDDTFCSRSLNGDTTSYVTRVELGCNAYQKSFVHWQSGNTSYLFFDSYS